MGRPAHATRRPCVGNSPSQTVLTPRPGPVRPPSTPDEPAASRLRMRGASPARRAISGARRAVAALRSSPGDRARRPLPSGCVPRTLAGSRSRRSATRRLVCRRRVRQRESRSGLSCRRCGFRICAEVRRRPRPSTSFASRSANGWRSRPEIRGGPLSRSLHSRSCPRGEGSPACTSA